MMATDGEMMGQMQTKQQSTMAENSSTTSAEALPAVRRGRGRKPKSPVKLPRLPFDRPRRKRRKKVPLDASASQAETISNGSVEGAIDQQQQQSSSVLTLSNKPLRLLLKMDDTGAYSHTIPNGGVNKKDDQPPPPLPLDDECSVEFFNSIKKSKKLKKKKKHHRHHHNSGSTSKYRSTDDDSQSAVDGLFKPDDDNVTFEVLVDKDDMIVDHHDTASNNGQLAGRSTSQQTTITLNGSSSGPPKNSLTNGSAESSSYPLTRVRKQKINYEEASNLSNRPRRSKTPKKSTPSWQPMEVDEVDDSELEDQQEQRNETQPPKDLSLYRQLRMRGVVEVDANNIQEVLARREQLQQLEHRLSNGARRKMLWNRSAARFSRFQEFLIHLLRKLKDRDPHRYFAWPITNSLLPGYLAVIRNPMDFNTIEKKITANLYTSVQEMKFDVRVLCENALKYHSQSGRQYRAAAKLWLYAKTKVFSFCAISRTLHAHFPQLTTSDVGLGWTHCPVAQKRGQQNEQKEDVDNNKSTQEQSSTTSLGFSKPLTLSSLLSDVGSEPKPSKNQTSSTSSSLVQLLNKQPTDSNDANASGTDENEQRRREELADGLLKGVPSKMNGDAKHRHNDVENEDLDDEDCKEITEEQIRQELVKQFGCDQKEEVERLVERLGVATKDTISSASFTRIRENGTTNLGFVVGGSSEDDIGFNDQLRQPTLGTLIGSLPEGSAALPEWNEPDDAPRLRPIKIVNTSLKENEPENPFTSHLPLLDTSKANVTLEESQLLLNTFGAFDTKFDDVIDTALKDQDYLLTFSGTLLDIVGKGEYSKQIGMSRCQLMQTKKVEETKPLENSIEEDLEHVVSNGENDGNKEINLQKKLNKTEQLLEHLQRVQRERLASRSEPIAPSPIEIKLAGRITHNLVEMIKDSTAPEHIYHLDAIRRAMGVVVKQDNNKLLPSETSNGDIDDTSVVVLEPQ